MAVFAVSGSSAGVFTWSASWDDGTRDLTIEATGQGRCTVTVVQSNGQMRTVAFVQNSGDSTLPVPPEFPAPTLTILIGDGPTVIPNINLNPSHGAHGDPGGGFEVVNESWSRI